MITADESTTESPVLDTCSSANRSMPLWLVGAIILVTFATVLLRLHTLTEPVDCDEAAYSYVSHRLLEGDRLYVDVFENKPPLAYLFYASGIATLGYSEFTVRVLPIPFVLATLLLLVASARRLSGDSAALATGILYGLLSCDPYLFANGANLEIFMILFVSLSIYASIRAAPSENTKNDEHRVVAPRSYLWLSLAGFALGNATAIKQVAGLYLLGIGIWWFVSFRGTLSRTNRVGGVVAIAAGSLLPWIACLGFAIWQGVSREFWDAVFVYGPALASDSSQRLIDDYGLRESAPQGIIPAALGTQAWAIHILWFFKGNPHANAWWGTVIWPLTVTSVFSLYTLRKHGSSRSGLLTAVLLATVASVLAPRLFWQHYYMLFIPICSLTVAVAWGHAIRAVRTNRAVLSYLIIVATILSTCWVGMRMTTDYVMLTPEQITSQHKGGNQWVSQRDVAQGLANIARVEDKMFVWGIQAPLHFYTQIDSVTPYFFTDPMLQTHSQDFHPLVEPRKQRIIADLMKHRPAFVFAGERPFPALLTLLRSEYTIAASLGTRGQGIYVRPDLLDRAEFQGIEQGPE